MVSSSAAQFIKMLVPDEHISIHKENIHLIGQTDAPLVEVYLNNELYATVITKDSTFHKQLRFGYGLNEVSIKPVYSGFQPDSSLYIRIDILYSPEIHYKYRKFYQPYIFHDANPKTECVTCHECDCDDLTEISDAATCLKCHSSLKEKFNKHTKAEDKTCIMCHELGTGLQAMFAGEDFTANPCFKCHNDKIKSFDQEYVHGPVAGGSCIVCHNPHGSEFEHSLNVPEILLCASCHSNIEDELEENDLHQPFKNGDCAKCHDPHSTNNRWVLLKSSEQLCLNCHKEQGTMEVHLHPYNVKPRQKLNVNLELTDKGDLECISCHYPHSSNSEHLLKVTEDFTCMGCHADMIN